MVHSLAPQPTLAGVILSGGRGSRMGGRDKGLIVWRKLPLYLHVAQRLEPQVTTLWINANRNLAAYQKSGYPIITDTLSDFPGPLAGMLSALEQVDVEWIVFASCDTPNLPANLVENLWRNKGDALAVWARSQERDHPTLALLHSSLRQPLRHYLQAGERKLLAFLQQAGGHGVTFYEAELAFANFNYPEDLIKE